MFHVEQFACRGLRASVSAGCSCRTRAEHVAGRSQNGNPGKTLELKPLRSVLDGIVVAQEILRSCSRNGNLERSVFR